MSVATTYKAVYTTPKGHDPECMCVPCMMADLDSAILANGLNPESYAFGNGENVAPERTRYATPGTRSGRGIVRKVSERQVRFIKRLMAERDTRNLVRLPGSEVIEEMSLAGARDLIERLLACPELPATQRPAPDLATAPQLGFIAKLISEKCPGREVDPQLTKRGASALIDELKAMRPAPRPVVAAAPTAEVTDGIYLVDGTVYKVQYARESGRPYAKELSKETGKFDYAPGALRRIRPEHKMTLEQAKEYGALYGTCCQCGRTLTNEVSIEAGIGPICAGKF